MVDAEGNDGQHDKQDNDDDGDGVVFLHHCGGLGKKRAPSAPGRLESRSLGQVADVLWNAARAAQQVRNEVVIRLLDP